MNSNNLFQTIYLSFFSSDLYSNIAKGNSFRFYFWLLILSFILALNLAIGIASTLYSLDNNKKVQYFFSQLPEITINKGTAESDVKQPYFINALNKKDALLILDTNNEISLEKISGPIILVDKRNVRFKFGNKIEKLSLNDLCIKIFGTNSVTLNQDNILDLVNKIKSKIRLTTFLFLIPFITLSFLFSNLFKIVFCSLIIFLILKLMKKPLYFKTITNLLVMAFIPSTIINIFIIRGFDRFLSNIALTEIAIIISLAYIIFATKSAIHKYNE